jgi:serine/threonine protein kinase
MVEILVELRERRVLHRDIRLDCLYLDANMILKLGDFGESCEYTGERRRSILKLTHFTSPEIINQLGHSYETDLWSVGVVTYTLLTGEEPFKSGESFSLSKIRNANFMFPPGLIINPKWKDILKRILVADAGERITLDALR